MKQHLLGEQLKEISYEQRIVLLSFVTGLNKEYMEAEYAKGIKDEESMLRAYGFDVKIGELIELIYNYTRQFPNVAISEGEFSISVSLEDEKGNTVEFNTNPQPSYCDALYVVVKELLNKKYIE